MIAWVLLAVLAAAAVKTMFFSFRAQKPQDYAGQGPAFVLTEHLSGRMVSEGVIYGPTGRVESRFVATMVGEWTGNTGTLSEEFSYAGGRTQSRKWHLTLGEGNRFTATAADIEGVAEGEVSGPTLSMQYVITLPEDAGGHRLAVTDWLYLTQDGVILNRSQMRKFGLTVAELVATMRPAPAQ